MKGRITMTFGDKCRHYRHAAKLTQQQAADAIEVSRRTYVYYETGRKLPRRRETVIRLAELFGIDPNLLIIEDDDRFIELQRERPVDERIETLLQEISAVLSDENVDQKQKQSFANELTRLCADFRSKETPVSSNDTGVFSGDNIYETRLPVKVKQAVFSAPYRHYSTPEE